MDLKKGQKIYKGASSLKVVEVSKSGKSAIVENAHGHQLQMRMTTIDEQWSKTPPK